MAMNENSKKILDYLKGVSSKGENVTAADVADALGLTKSVVNGTFTSFSNKKLGTRVPATVTNEDGTSSEVKVFVLSDTGLSYDPVAEEAKELAEKEAKAAEKAAKKAAKEAASK